MSTLSLYLLRAMYLFMAVGLAIFKLRPAILHPENLSSQDSVIVSVLGAFALLAVLGIHYPLKMLPLLLRVRVEVHLGLGSRAAPIASGQLDRNASFGGTETLINCLLGIVLVPLVTPWGYVLKHYWKAPGDRWGKLVTVRPLPSDRPKIVA